MPTIVQIYINASWKRSLTYIPLMAGSSRSTMGDNQLPSFFTYEQLQELQQKFDLLTQVTLSLGMSREKVRRTRFHVMEQIHFVEKVLEEQATSHRESLDMFNQELSSEDETEELRHLFVSNGCAVCLLDLKQRTDEPSLPKVSTLTWSDTGLLSLGLFGFQSRAFVIGGQEFPELEHSCRYTNRSNRLQRSYDIYKPSLCSCYYNMKGTSREMYELCLYGDILRLGGSMSRMNEPKMWPIVELLDGFLHVFESCPYFSHEVLECDIGPSWRKIPTSGGPVKNFIDAHLVIGHCIYAMSGRSCFLFDSRKMKWETVHEPKFGGGLIRPGFSTVWDILLHGPAKCVLEVDSLYVLLVFVSTSVVHCSPADDGLIIVPMAYLVRSTGEIVAMQNLSSSGFFREPMLPAIMNKACVISGGKMGNVMCSIVNARGFCTEEEDELGRGNYLFINTFTVRKIDGATSELDLSGGLVSYGVDFVRIHVKDRYIFETDEEGGDLPGFLSLQACFI